MAAGVASRPFLPVRLNLSVIEEIRGEVRSGEERLAALSDEYPENPLLTCFLAYFRSHPGVKVNKLSTKRR